MQHKFQNFYTPFSFSHSRCMIYFEFYLTTITLFFFFSFFCTICMKQRREESHHRSLYNATKNIAKSMHLITNLFEIALSYCLAAYDDNDEWHREICEMSVYRKKSFFFHSFWCV